MYFYHYKVRYFDDYEEKIDVEEGLSIGEDFSDTISRLERFYGKGNIEEIYVSYLEGPWDDSPVEDVLPTEVIVKMMLDKTDAALERVLKAYEK